MKMRVGNKQDIISEKGFAKAKHFRCKKCKRGSAYNLGTDWLLWYDHAHNTWWHYACRKTKSKPRLAS